MRVTVIPIPNRRVTRRGVIFEAIDHHLDRSGSVRNEHKIELVGIGIEEAQSSFSYGVHPVSSQGRRS